MGSYKYNVGFFFFPPLGRCRETSARCAFLFYFLKISSSDKMMMIYDALFAVLLHSSVSFFNASRKFLCVDMHNLLIDYVK